jgi:hypothetical protein
MIPQPCVAEHRQLASKIGSDLSYGASTAGVASKEIASHFLQVVRNSGRLFVTYDSYEILRENSQPLPSYRSPWR